MPLFSHKRMKRRAAKAGYRDVVNYFGSRHSYRRSKKKGYKV